MYLFFIQHSKDILSDDGPFATFSHERVRFVFRPTRVYGAILQRSLMPELLQNGLSRSIELEMLSRAFVTASTKPKAWPLLQAEIKALEQLDIPYFAAYPDSNALTVGIEQPIEEYFEAPSYCQAQTRLEQLCEQDMLQQVALMRDSFYARVAATFGLEKPAVNKAEQEDKKLDIQSTPLTPSELIQGAMAIAQQLQERAIRGSDGSVNWIGLAYVSKADRYQLQPLSENLYDGRCGIALFFAALYSISDQLQYRQLALDSLLTMQKILQSTDEERLRKFAKRTGIGGAVGLGSIVYAMVRVGKLANYPALLDDAMRAAKLITPDRIVADSQFDIIEGAAGAILGLLALYRATSGQVILETAMACAEHLLSHQTQLGSLPRAWKTVGQQPPTGFSHGAAGIAYALLQLYELTNMPAFYQAAAEGVRYENSVYSEAHANWPHVNSSDMDDSQSEFRVSWCSGAPGIGLARLGNWTIHNTEQVSKDIENALRTTQTHNWQGVDHLCCGNFGRIDTLLTGSQILSRQDWFDAAQRKAAWVIARARGAGGYQLFVNLPRSVFNPGLFQGLSARLYPFGRQKRKGRLS